MARKPGHMYKKVTGPAYTRKEYMGGIPGSKVVHYDMGNLTDEFPVAISIVAKEACQIRHIAIEAARITANKYLSELGRPNYHFKIRIHPHHILRENKQATGAGADRVSQGMRCAFGKAVSTAARVKAGQKLMTVEVEPNNFLNARESLRKAGHKLPTPTSYVIERGAELIK
ncbi:MAG: 50S ribosomal protein L10e [Candidatus Syntrophoarchaeum sp. GoM_oil]|nr:MAG: 50S ribosomal protein L10e [Candidatus Syntrophoarchaeum sp. GoM_oil]